MTVINKVHVIDNKDGKGVSFAGNNPEEYECFHCNSRKDAFKLKNLINKFVEQQIQIYSEWE